MKRLMTMAAVCILAGAVLAGCTRNDDTSGATTPTTPVVSRPEAAALATPLTPTAGQAVRFEAANPGTSTVAWEFGDGTKGDKPVESHTYAAPGRYIVTLKLTNAAGSDTTERNPIYLTVTQTQDFANATSTQLPPVADFTVDRQIIKPGESVTVNATTSYTWVENPRYNVTVGLTPNNVPLLRDCRPAAQGGCGWNASGPANITSIEWDWGDGTAKTSGAGAVQEATHTFAAAGSYPVKLTIKDSSGNTGTTVATVLVLAQGSPVGGYKSKDLYVVATISGPQSFDPGFDYETAGGHVIEQVYETLFSTERGNTDKIVPLLAAEVPTKENGGISADGLTYTIKIRQGVKFHDGTDVDANAVKFSLDRLVLMKHPTSGAPVVTPLIKGADEFRKTNGTKADRDAWLALQSVKVLDKHTVQLTLPKHDAALFQRLAFYAASIVSPTAVKACHSERVPLWGACSTADGLPPVGITRDPWMDITGVGTGPFKLRKWLPGDRTILDRNEEYWDPAHKAKVKTAIIRYVDDLNTRILMLKNGDADEIYVPTSEVDRVRPTLEGIARFVPADTLIVDAVFFNYKVEDQAACPKVAGAADCELFKDPKVRQALILAYDYKNFFDNVWQGRAKPLAGVIPRGMPGYDDSLSPYRQDLDAAKALLAQTKCKDGCEIQVYYNTGNTVREKGAQIMKDSWELLGMGTKVQVVGLPFDQLLDKSQNHQIPVQWAGWSPDYIATDDYIVPFLHSTGYFPQNMNIREPDIEKKIDEAIAETDPQKQAKLFRDINKMAVDRYVSLYLDQRSQVHVERLYVQGYYYDPLDSGSPNSGDLAALSKA